MSEEYIKKLEEENQLLHKQNEDLLEYSRGVPLILENLIDLKRKYNFTLEGYLQSVEGYNTLIKYLVEKKEFKIEHNSLTSFVTFPLDENYQDNMCPEHCPYTIKDLEKITEEECFAAGFVVGPNKDCYEKQNDEYPHSPYTIFPSDVIDTTLDGTHMAQTFLPTGAYIEPPLTPKPKGFNVCPIQKST